MAKKLNLFSIISSSILVSLLLFSVGCGSKAKQAKTSQGYMDTPSFHVQQGDKALMEKSYEPARNSYRKALKLDPSYSAALSGMAAATAYAASRPDVSDQTKQQVLEQTKSQIEEAIDNTPSDKKSVLARAHIYGIQIHYALKLPKDSWYDEITDHFNEAIELTPDAPEPYFFMARAEAIRLNYAGATRLFHKVLAIDGKFSEEANSELEKIQQIQRALPGSQFGAKIAGVEKITRADVAALFIVELKLERIYRNQIKKSENSFHVPRSQQKMKTDSLQRYPDAVDIYGHPLEGAIKKVIQLEIKGLSPNPAHKFYPDQELKRAEFAQLIQDILIKITKDSSMATKYIGDPSPFPDVDSDVWYYNAVRTVVNRSLMKVNNAVTGEFQPFASVSGAEALLTIRTLKGILKANF